MICVRGVGIMNSNGNGSSAFMDIPDCGIELILLYCLTKRTVSVRQGEKEYWAIDWRPIGVELAHLSSIAQTIANLLQSPYYSVRCDGAQAIARDLRMRNGTSGVRLMITQGDLPRIEQALWHMRHNDPSTFTDFVIICDQIRQEFWS